MKIISNVDEIMSRDSGLFARFLIGKTRHSLLMVRQKELTPYNITPQQADVVFIIYNLDHKATLAELSKYTNRGISALSIQLTRMEKDGLVKKTRENPKSALLKYQLTKKGLKMYKDTENKKAYETIMSVLSKEECQQLISTLQKVFSRSEQYQKEEF